MHRTFRGVNEAFVGLVSDIHNRKIPTIRTSSRNGDVLQIAEPVIITYEQPCERVLFNDARDANPFFHLYEALWMLAGRNDVKPITYYTSQMAQFSDDGKIFNGAYGYRWRHAKDGDTFDGDGINGTDQLKVIVNHLKASPDSRRAVLQMWNVQDDLLKILPSMNVQNSWGEGDHARMLLPVPPSKDVCCNLSACFAMRFNREAGDGYGCPTYLDMTVFNRSNDMILGMLGANAVHFSFLQEYMAGQLGVRVGVYNQISNNLHVYESNWKPDEWLAEITHRTHHSVPIVTYRDNVRKQVPLIKSPATFDTELSLFVELNSDGSADNLKKWKEPFFDTVAQPMCHAYTAYKKKDFTAAAHWLNMIADDAWRITAANWIRKRQAKTSAKESVNV